MVIIPPFPIGTQTTITLKTSAVDQTPYFGGPVQRVARLGDKWSYTVDMRPMQSRQSRPLVMRLLQGLNQKVQCPVVIAGINLADQINLTAVSGAGSSINFIGNGSFLMEGQFFSIVKNGSHYLHMITSQAGQTVNFMPPLKVPITGGETLEFVAPKIEGFLDGTEQGFTIGMVANVGLTFRVNEAA